MPLMPVCILPRWTQVKVNQHRSLSDLGGRGGRVKWRHYPDTLKFKVHKFLWELAKLCFIIITIHQ